MPDDFAATFVAMLALGATLIAYVAWRVAPMPAIARTARDGAGHLALHVPRAPARSFVWMRFNLAYEGVEDDYAAAGEVVVRADGRELWRDRVTVAYAGAATSQPLDPVKRDTRVATLSTWHGAQRHGEAAATMVLGEIARGTPGPVDVDLVLDDGPRTRLTAVSLWVSR